MTTYATAFDRLVDALRRATPRGRSRMLASHRKLIRRGVHLPAVPPGYRVVAGELVPVDTEPICAYPRRED